jgi:hypothetical protein
MHQITLTEFKKAVETLDLLSLTSREDVHKRYLKLSRIYHPDMQHGSTTKFQEINSAYEIIKHYMDNFRFLFNEEEFKRQNPILVSTIWSHISK